MVRNGSIKSSRTIKFESKAEDIIKKIKDEINEHRNNRVNYSSEAQLEKFINEVNKMLDVPTSKDFTPSFPRAIVDSWDFNNTLGLELLDLFELYKKAK